MELIVPIGLLILLVVLVLGFWLDTRGMRYRGKPPTPAEIITGGTFASREMPDGRIVILGGTRRVPIEDEVAP